MHTHPQFWPSFSFWRDSLTFDSKIRFRGVHGWLTDCKVPWSCDCKTSQNHRSSTTVFDIRCEVFVLMSCVWFSQNMVLHFPYFGLVCLKDFVSEVLWLHLIDLSLLSCLVLAFSFPCQLTVLWLLPVLLWRSLVSCLVLLPVFVSFRPL